MKLKYEFVVRQIAGDYILVPSGASALALSGLITTNEVGALLVEKLKQDASREALIAAVLQDFQVEETIAAADVDRFLMMARKLNILE